MLRFLQVLLFFSYYYSAFTAQPYFPPQIVFTLLGGQYLYGIDEINQRAVLIDATENIFVFKHIPYAIPDSPESKHYVQLINDLFSHNCLCK